MGTALIPFLAFALVFLASLARRDGETDAKGNPSLRFWSGCVLGLVAGVFFLSEALINLHDPFHQRYPENTLVEALLSLFGFLVGLWSYFFRITLKANVIEVCYPLLWYRAYRISDVDRIDTLGRNSGAIQMKSGRRILMTGLYSGREDFLVALRTALAEQPAALRD